jgi:hypothetical protein
MVFGCEHDGRAALDTFKREQRDEMLRIDGDVVTETVAPKRPRGRPKKSEAPAPTKTQYRLRIRIEGDEEAVKTAVGGAGLKVGQGAALKVSHPV